MKEFVQFNFSKTDENLLRNFLTLFIMFLYLFYYIGVSENWFNERFKSSAFLIYILLNLKKNTGYVSSVVSSDPYVKYLNSLSVSTLSNRKRKSKKGLKLWIL